VNALNFGKGNIENPAAFKRSAIPAGVHGLVHTVPMATEQPSNARAANESAKGFHKCGLPDLTSRVQRTEKTGVEKSERIADHVHADPVACRGLRRWRQWHWRWWAEGGLSHDDGAGARSAAANRHLRV
jgi:hypothetical protein